MFRAHPRRRSLSPWIIPIVSRRRRVQRWVRQHDVQPAVSRCDGEDSFPACGPHVDENVEHSIHPGQSNQSSPRTAARVDCSHAVSRETGVHTPVRAAVSMLRQCSWDLCGIGSRFIFRRSALNRGCALRPVNKNDPFMP